MTKKAKSAKSTIAKTPIEAQKNVELIECGIDGAREARILTHDTSNLEWDRFMRISKVAERVKALELPDKTVILDVGGFDGTFALFVPKLRVYVIDPETTGGSGMALPFPDNAFEVVTCIDALEHLPQQDRPKLLKELLRVTKSRLFINFPEAKSTKAQEQVLALIPNRFIKEHVNYQLPIHDEVVALIKKINPSVKIEAYPHTNFYVWAPWYVLFHSVKPSGVTISHFLKAHSKDVNSPPFLYDLLDCRKL